MLLLMYFLLPRKNVHFFFTHDCEDFWYISLSVGGFSCMKLYFSELPMLLAHLSSGDVTVRPRDLAVQGAESCLPLKVRSQLEDVIG
jgi:hypothetical protein